MKIEKAFVVTTVLAAIGSVFGANFQQTPYVQHPATNAMSLIWFTDSACEATVKWRPEAGGDERQAVTTGILAPALTNNVYQGESGITPKYRHRVRMTDLEPGTRYSYSVTLPDGTSYANTFKTAPDANSSIRFMYFNDSETKPDNPNTSDWADPNNNDKTRTYYITPTEGYKQGLARMKSRNPDLFVMAGDLAWKGGYQTHWDEFWRHNAGGLGTGYDDPAGSIPILAAIGNHDLQDAAACPPKASALAHCEHYLGGESALERYLTYFEYEPNGVDFSDVDDRDRSQMFHRVDYGPVTFIFLDTNNGDDSDPEKDTNTGLFRDPAVAASYGLPAGRSPDFNPGSKQYTWLTNQLADAQQKAKFTFVVNHQCPYSAGYHNRTNVTESGEWLSGRAVRVLKGAMLKYGVDGWLCGHDEMMEHARIEGEETLPDGTTRPHHVDVFDMGTIGNGLRGGFITNEGKNLVKTQRVYEDGTKEIFRAYVDEPEVWENGVLVAGGVHYTHMEVDVQEAEPGLWTCTMTPNYLFTSNSNGRVGSEWRTYNDVLVLTNDLRAPVIPSVEVQTKGTTWEIESTVADGTVASGAAAVVPCVEGWDEYAMQVVKGSMTWRKDPAPRFTYPDAFAGEPDRAYSNSLATVSNANYGNAGLSLANAVTKLALTNGFTLECYLRVDPGSPQWSRLVEVLRADTYNQYTNGLESSFAFVLQQSSTAAEGGTFSLQLRTDTQSPATNRWEQGGGFNAGRCRQTAKVGEWFHWALAYDATSLTIRTWIDGKNEQSSVLSRGLQFDDENAALVFGERMFGSVGFVKFTPRALTAAELMPSACASMSDALVGPVRGWWRFEGGVNGAQVEPNTVASLVNSAWWSVEKLVLNAAYTNDVPSVLQNVFTGDELLAKGNAGSLVLSKGYLQMQQTRAAAAASFTAECFVRDLGGSSQFGTILQQTRADVVYEDANGTKTTAAGMSAWFLTMGEPGLRIRFDTVPREGVKPANGTNWNQCYDGKKSVRDGKWHHAALTYDGPTRTGTLYIDYEKDGSIVTAYPVPVEKGNFLIGINNYGSRSLNMEIDEVRFTAEVLPPEKFLRFRGDPAMFLFVR